MTLKNQLSCGKHVLSPDLSDFIHQDKTSKTQNGTRDAERTLRDERSSFCNEATKPEKQLCGQEEKAQQKSSGQPVDADQFKTAEENELPDFLLQLLRPVPVNQLDAPDSSDPHESETQEQLPGIWSSGESVVKRSVSQILDSLFLDLYEEDDISPSLRPVPVNQLDAPDSSDSHESETQEQLSGIWSSGGCVVKRSVSQILDSLFLDLYEEDNISPSLSVPHAVYSERDFSADQLPSSSEAADGSTVTWLRVEPTS